MEIERPPISTKLLTTESVSEGHPDKIADQIAEAICDFCLQQDPCAKVACEVFFADCRRIIIGGEIGGQKLQKYAFHLSKDNDSLVSTSILKAKFKERIYQIVDNVLTKIDPQNSLEKVNISIRLQPQSEEISASVGISQTDQINSTFNLCQSCHEKHDVLKAGDNSTVFGFANSDPGYFPVFQRLANRILQNINNIRKNNSREQTNFCFAPDGKVQILFDLDTRRVHRIVLCQQFEKVGKINTTTNKVERQKFKKKWAEKTIQIEKKIIVPLLQELRLSKELKGNNFLELKPFEKGGANADSGLTGRKLLIDTYGVFCKHGGGSFSGKDSSKTDRSLALFARFIAKHLVALKLVKEITVQVSSVFGEKRLVNITPLLSNSHPNFVVIEKIITKFFASWDIEQIVNRLRLKHTPFFPFASYGYFGRTDLHSSWEKTTELSKIQKWLLKEKHPVYKV